MNTVFPFVKKFSFEYEEMHLYVEMAGLFSRSFTYSKLLLEFRRQHQSNIKQLDVSVQRDFGNDGFSAFSTSF